MLMLLYMLISPLTNTIINIDEYWTYSLVNLPFMQGMITHSDIDSRRAFNEEKAAYLDSINNNSTVIVYNSDYTYKVLHNDLNNTRQYTLSGRYFYDDDITVLDNLTKILNKNKAGDVYLVNWKNHPANKELEKNYDLNKTYDAGHYSFNLVEG